MSMTGFLSMFLTASCLWVVTMGAAKAKGDAAARSGQRVVIVKSGKGGAPYVLSGPMLKRGYLGVNLLELSPELRAHFGVDRDVGVLVSSVEPKSPAAKGGILVGDVIVGMDGEKVDAVWGVAHRIRRKKGGDEVRFQIVRERKPRELTVAVGVREKPQIDVSELFFFGMEHPDRLELEAESIEEALQKMRQHLKKLGRHKDILEYYRLERDLEKRLRQVEEKLQRLEKKLD